MRALGTYFEQVPKAVIEKMLAQQAPPAENEMSRDEAVTKRAASNALNETKSRNSKP
jgi:hypothetical protein